MKRFAILGATFLASATLFPSMSSAQSIECASEVPAARTGHWYYRLIDGRKCWYQGKAMMPKSSLHWPKSSVSEAEDAKPASDARPTTDGRNVSASPPPEPAAPPETEPAAWPTTAPPAWPTPTVDDTSFESRWSGLKS